MPDNRVEQSDGLDKIATIDLGSNSFHMAVARMVDGQPVIIDRIREQVQLAAGLDAERRLTDKAQERAIACLARFGQQLRDMPVVRARAVGTSTLRVARNSREFLDAAEPALGVPIEVVSGREEARLIYLGVAHDLADDEGRRLVVDIGGGSTECALGRRFETVRAHSISRGCVTHTRRAFPDGVITEKALKEAVLAAQVELQMIERDVAMFPPDDVVGASGTIRAVAGILRENGWADEGITRSGLRRLRQALVEAGHIDRLELPGLSAERAPVFPGGVAILTAVFRTLGVRRMRVSSGSLREGILYDLLGRLRHEDVRQRTIRGFQGRYDVDLQQAARVGRTALECLAQVEAGWGLEDTGSRRYLAWAARLHEIGLSISFSGHHRHAAYLVENSDMPGFSRDDQLVLAALIGAHRRKIKLPVYEGVPTRLVDATRRMIVLLRLAVLLNRSRGDASPDGVVLKVDDDRLKVVLPPDWLEKNPLTREDLRTEAKRVKLLGVKLVIKS